MDMLMPRHLTSFCAALLVASAALPVPVRAQADQFLARAQADRFQVVQLPAGTEGAGAEATRSQLRELMKQYPPALGRVLKLDPTLLANPQYLAPYPTLAAFLKQHPEVARYPSYFLSFVPEGDWASREPASPEVEHNRSIVRMWENVMIGMFILLIVGVVSGALVALVKSFVEHRRWLRATRIQSEFHNRLLERMGSSAEVLAYAQSSGRDLLPQVPRIEPAGAALAPPFGRILWSVQAGLVAAAAGVGLLFVKQYVAEEIGQMLLTLGVLTLSLGIGFALAAAASYMLSVRLGLFTPARPADRREPLGG
jgi:hypothetical protein